MDLSDRSKWADTQTLKHVVKAGEEGLYSLVYARCAPDESRDGASSFHLEAKFYNPGPSYLSACEAALSQGLRPSRASSGSAPASGGSSCAGEARARAPRAPAMGVFSSSRRPLAARAARYAAADRTGSGGGWADAHTSSASRSGRHAVRGYPPRGHGLVDRQALPERPGAAHRRCGVGPPGRRQPRAVALEEAAPGRARGSRGATCCTSWTSPAAWPSSCPSCGRSGTCARRRRRAARRGHGRQADALPPVLRVMVVAYVYFTRIVVFLLAATCVEIAQCAGCMTAPS